MNMKINLMITFAAALALLPVLPTSAADAKAAKADEAEVKEGPTEAQMAKARKINKQRGGKPYAKVTEALAAAEQCNFPLMAFLLRDDDTSQFIDKKLMTFKPFKDDLAKNTFVLLKLKLKTADNKDAKEKKVDLKPLKEPERKFLENFGLDDKAVANAKRDNKKEPTFDWASNYPAIVMVSPNGTKLLARLPKYDAEGGPGVWITTVIDTLRTAGFEPQLTKLLEKITENPTEPKKWK